MERSNQNGFRLNRTTPVKLTESRRLRVNTIGWGALTEYTLESVKVTRKICDRPLSTAILRVADRSGHVSCIIIGPDVGLLFGMSREQWKSVENLTKNTKQLFYRYFQNGIRDDFPTEQKMFYYFCHSCQTKDLLFVEFMRVISQRKIDQDRAFLKILNVHKCSPKLLELYDSAFSGMCSNFILTESVDSVV